MRKLLLIAAALLPMIICAVAPERQRKADYYYMEAASRDAAGDHDAATLLLMRSVELDSVSSTVPGGMLGSRLLILANGDSALTARGLSLLERHVAAHPSDLYLGFDLALNYERLQMKEKMLATWRMLDSLNSDNTSLLLRRAVVEHRYNSNAEALDLFRRVEKLEGPNCEFAYKQAQLMVWMGDTVGASARMHRMVEERPKDPEAYTYISVFYDMVNNHDSASIMLDKALELDPTFEMALFNRVYRLYEAGKTEEYGDAVASAIGDDNLSMAGKAQMLKDYIGSFARDNSGATEEQIDRADTLVASLVAQYPLDPEIRSFAGAFYFGIEDFARAAENISVLADMSREDPKVWNFLTRLYSSAEMMPQALENARTTVGYWPDNMDARELLGLILAQENQYEEAIGVFEGSLKLPDAVADPKVKSDIYRCMADVWQQAERFDSTEACYDRAIAIDPDNVLALNNYAYYLATYGKELSRAEQMSSRSMMIEPGQPTYLDTYAWVLFKLGEYQKAQGYIDTALLRSADNLSAELLDHAGDIAFKLGQTDRALDYWKEALELEPDNERIARKVETGKME